MTKQKRFNRKRRFEMRKILILGMTVLILSMVVVSCDKEETCNHKWIVNSETDSDGWKVTTQPTETTDGSKTRTCSECGKIETVSIPKTGGGPIVVGTIFEGTWSAKNQTMSGWDTYRYIFVGNTYNCEYGFGMEKDDDPNISMTSKGTFEFDEVGGTITIQVWDPILFDMVDKEVQYDGTITLNETDYNSGGSDRGEFPGVYWFEDNKLIIRLNRDEQVPIGGTFTKQ